MIRSFQFRCRPTSAQTAALNGMVYLRNAIYNAGLEQRIAAYRNWCIHHHKKPAWENHKHRINGKKKEVPVIRPKHAPGEAKHSLSWYDQKADIKIIRKENPEYAAFLQRIPILALKDVDLAFEAFFRRVKRGEKPGFPRFKSSRRIRQTLKLGEGVKWHKGKGDFGHIQFKGLPGKLRFKIHNPKFSGDDVTVKTTMLTRDHKGWLVTFQCELPDVRMQDIAVADTIGIDVGIGKFLTEDDGAIVPNPRFLEKELPALRRAQRALMRKKKGDGNRQRVRMVVARLHHRVQNLRKNFHFETAAELVGKGKNIGVEDLNIGGLSRGMLARHVNDVAWGYFLNRLVHKAESAGLQVVKVDPKNTSQACSGCGALVGKSLAVREHRCEACGLVLDRDHNAAINIKNKAVASLEGANFGVARSCPQNLSLASH